MAICPTYSSSRRRSARAAWSPSWSASCITWISAAGCREIYEEGLRLPPQKLCKAGVENAELIEMIHWNVRVPDKVIGDLRAQVTATHVGAARIEGVLAEKNWDDLDALGEELLDRTEAAMRAAIREVPDGHYEYEMIAEKHRGEDIVIRMGIDVTGDEMLIDYTGTTAQIDRAINVVFNYTNAHTIYAVKCALARNLPSNEGCIRPIKVTAPLGTIVNAEFPISVNQRAQIGHLLPELVFQALSPVIPDHVIAGSGSTPLWSHVISGAFGDKRPFLVYFGMQGGLGARGHNDGVTCLCRQHAGRGAGAGSAAALRGEIPDDGFRRRRAVPGRSRPGLHHPGPRR